MKKVIFQFFILLGLLLLVFLGFSTLMPIVKSSDANISESKFSVERAFVHVKKISEAPHFIGSDEHGKVRSYIVDEFQKLGLKVHTQNGYAINDYKILANPNNIIAVLEGSDAKPKSDLLVMAHYDSDPHSSYGAGDDAAGVAAILESLRAFLYEDKTPKNNIIFLISDAEEIGLLGAQLFVEHHPLIENIGLVLNFEARGTSGPSNAILETNYGNKNLVQAFDHAKPQFPMASSLMYEIYKNMPNDTDATVFRERKNIPSFFFAFIDGHYNYHAATDTAENLNKNSLAHQGSYLMSLLPHFGNEDLSEFETHRNNVFFNFPIFKLIEYDYAWIFPLLALAWILFFVLIIYGIRKKRFTLKKIGQGYIPLFLSLIAVGLLGFFGWKIILFFYPQYLEIQQGFPYNGHLYVAVFVCFALALLFLTYSYFWKVPKRIGIFIAPLSLWLMLLTFLSISFKGATYFIFPIFFFELVLFLMLWKVNFPSIFRLFLSIPAIFIFSPLVLFVPVALGLKSIFAGLLILMLQAYLILPVFGNFKRKKSMTLGLAFFGVFFLLKAHAKSDFSPERPKPNSLVYLTDLDNKNASWNTYDLRFDKWTQPYFSQSQKTNGNGKDFGSKYGQTFSYSQKADFLDIPGVEYYVEKDSLENGKANFKVKIIPERNLHRIILYSASIKEIEDFEVNGLAVDRNAGSSSKMRKVRADDPRLLTYYPVDADTLFLDFKLPDSVINADIQVYGASHDLLENQWIKVYPREKYMMPKPFLLNDVIITKQRISIR